MIAETFIRRPVTAIVISIVIVLVGLISLFKLPVAQYPEVTPPTVLVTALYPGANAQTVRDTVAAPIEEQINRPSAETKRDYDVLACKKLRTCRLLRLSARESAIVDGVASGH